MFFVSEHTTMFFINFYRSTKSMLERYIFFVTGRQVGLVVKTGPVFLYAVPPLDDPGVRRKSVSVSMSRFVSI